MTDKRYYWRVHSNETEEIWEYGKGYKTINSCMLGAISFVTYRTVNHGIYNISVYDQESIDFEDDTRSPVALYTFEKH